MEILARSRLTSEEQPALPASVLQFLGINVGDELIWMKDDDGRVLIERARSYTLADIRASVAAVGPTSKPGRVSVRAMKHGIAKHVRGRHNLHRRRPAD